MTRSRVSLVLVVALGALSASSGCGDGGSAPPRTTAAGCARRYDTGHDYFPAKARVEEATGFSVSYRGHYKVVTNTRPSPGSTERLTYVLVQCGTPAPRLTGRLGGATVIRVPVRKVVTMSTTYLPELAAIGSASLLAGVDNFDYVNTPAVRRRIDRGELRAVGNGAQANLELLAALSPDVVVTQATGDESADGIARMRQAGTKVVVDSDWLEETPLGRAEWVKYISLFVNREAAADTTFARISARYRALARRLAQAGSRPMVLTNAPYQGTWFVPGGGSFSARLIRDAGGSYAFADDHSTGGRSLDFEAVFNRAAGADVWLPNDPNFTTLAAARRTDTRFGTFRAFRDENVFNNDAKVNKAGGNDYFETAALRADLLLADVAAILHPDVEPGHRFVWFRKVPA